MLTNSSTSRLTFISILWGLNPPFFFQGTNSTLKNWRACTRTHVNRTSLVCTFSFNSSSHFHNTCQAKRALFGFVTALAVLDSATNLSFRWGVKEGFILSKQPYGHFLPRSTVANFFLFHSLSSFLSSTRYFDVKRFWERRSVFDFMRRKSHVNVSHPGWIVEILHSSVSILLLSSSLITSCALLSCWFAWKKGVCLLLLRSLKQRSSLHSKWQAIGQVQNRASRRRRRHSSILLHAIFC